MKNRIKTLLCLAGFLPMLYACSNGDDAFTTSGDASGTIPSALHISLASSEVPANVFTGTLADPATYVWEVNHEVEISVVVGDNNNFRISGGTVRFATDYGLLSATSCTLIQGTCSIKWYSEGSSQAPIDNSVSITAWIMGEEGYWDNDDSGNFNDNDVWLTDTPEPFIDYDHDGVFTPGTDAVIDVDKNGAHTPADGLFNGTNCTHSTLCSGTTSIPVFDILLLSMDARS